MRRKKMKGKKIISLLTALCLSGSVALGLTACKKKGGGSDISGADGNIPAPVSPVTAGEAHYVTNSLHNVNVNYDNPVGTFVKNGSTEYKIVGGDWKTTGAVSLIQRQTFAASKVDVPESGEGEVGGKYIFIGKDDAFEEAGLSLPDYSELGVSGYMVTTVGESVFIQAYTDRGYQMGAIAFLKYVLGYEKLSADMVVFVGADGTIPAMDIVEAPDYAYRVASNKMTSAKKYDMGFSTGELILNTGTNAVHNITDFTTNAEKAAHPLWFSDTMEIENGKLKNDQWQPCFTAHGDETEYNAMTETYTNAIIGFMKAKPSVDNIRISQNDVMLGYNDVTHCSCDACRQSYEHYGNTISGAMLTFTNDVADKVSEYLDSDQARKDGFSENKEFNIVLLAYGTGVKAPVVHNANGDIIYDEEGKGQPDDLYRFIKDENGTVQAVLQKDENGNTEKLYCHNRVSVEYAASAANYVHSFYEIENQVYANAVKAWAGLGGKMYLWLYEVNYWMYFYPYNSFETIPENLRFFKSYNASYVYSEGSYENSNCSGFAKLRDYLAAKFEFNCNYNYGEVVDFWFENYFAEAEPFMRQYFNELQANQRAKESKTGGGVHSNALAGEEIWPQGMINHWINLFDKAYEAIESYKETDPDKYEILYKNILIESLFPRLVLCTTYASTYNDTQLKVLRKAFYNDFNSLQNTHLKEGQLADVVFADWDLD